jgi:hypothetical protein
MPNLLEITGDDVARLDDADLRALIGLLCEADYRLAGLPTKGITWGGHQNARDGGLDVAVRGETPPPQSSFVPRSITGFQVKKPDMPKAEILKEPGYKRFKSNPADGEIRLGSNPKRNVILFMNPDFIYDTIRNDDAGE